MSNQSKQDKENSEQKIEILAPVPCCADGCILTDSANGCSVYDSITGILYRNSIQKEND